jgi:hypothetical protein
LEDPRVDGRIILRLIFRKWDGDMNWIDLVFGFHKMRGIYLLAENWLASQEWLWSMK